MTKGEAREAVAKIVAAQRNIGIATAFGEFVERVYFEFYSRKWKPSTRSENLYRAASGVGARIGSVGPATVPLSRA